MPETTEKFYFFIDLNCETNLKDDLPYYAAGIVLNAEYNNFDKDKTTDKDFCVEYIDPRGDVLREWRALDEVRLIETTETNYKTLQSTINRVAKHSVY